MLTPRAEAFKAFLSSEGDYSVRDAATALMRDPRISDIGEKRLRDRLIEWRWLYRASDGKPRAMQAQIDNGRFAHRALWHYHPGTGERVADAPQVRITPKGLDAIRRRLVGDEPEDRQGALIPA